MKYFSNSFFKFFDGLAKNNNKEWFEKNRPVYENEVKAPFRKLVEDVTTKLSKDLPELSRDAGKSIFRINRDIRFSKDKSPYKNHVAAVFSPLGTKDLDYPGFYIHFGLDEVMVGGGKYFVSKEQLAKIRQEIFYNNDTFKKLLNDKAFKKVYKNLTGEKSKILEPRYKEFLAEQPLIANKQFWYSTSLTRSEVTGDKLDTLLYNSMKAGIKINKFFEEAVKN
jgi:uncharacterized protein (TIGR02453 family)